MAGLESELLAKVMPTFLENAERIGLPTGAIQRHHQQRAQSFVQRSGGHEFFEFGNGFLVATELELDVEPSFDQREAQLGQPGDGTGGEVVVDEVGERVAAPERVGLGQPCGRLVQIAHVEGGARRGREPLVTEHVDRAGRQLEDVPAAAHRDEIGRTQCAPQLGYEPLQTVADLRRRVLAPEGVDNLVGGDHSSRLQGENGEERAQLRSGDDHLVSVVIEHVESTEQMDQHALHRTPGRGASVRGQERVSVPAQSGDMRFLTPASSTRRERQVIQIATLVQAGQRARATGLTLEHAQEFPDDVGVLAQAAGDIRAFDVVIIGGGAAGLSAALVLGRARRRVAVVDAGAPRNAPASHMQGFLSRDGMSPADFLAAGRAEIAGYGVELLEDQVLGIEPGFLLRLARGAVLTARRIVLATGVSDELPDIPGVRERWGRDLLHCPYCHGWEVRDQPLGVLGSHPGAVQHAQLVRQWSADVIFFAHTHDVTDAERTQLGARGIHVVDGAVARLGIEDDRLTGVELVDGRVIARTAVFVRPVNVPHADGVVSNLGCDRDDAGFVTVDATGRTSVPGVWAAGNAVDPRAQVITAAGAGSAAAIAVNADLVHDDVSRTVISARTLGG